MKLGYPCVNTVIGCTSSSTFRLVSYSEEKLIEKVANNLSCLKKILEYNVKHKIYFFRISSDIIPFASHPICRCDWPGVFSGELSEIGKYIIQNNIRISMHPDPFVILNAERESVLRNSISEINYHCVLLDSMGLGPDCKVQIHAGGVYADRENSIKRFIENYSMLEPVIKKRLVLENDDRSYTLGDCLRISKEIDIPVLLDVFHHQCLSSGQPLARAMQLAGDTWKEKDGVPMVDYSIQKKGGRKGSHAGTIDMKLFGKFLDMTRKFDFDIMLEIKDKQASALRALKLLEPS